MIAVLGAGSWGTALAVTLARNNVNNQFILWGRSSYTNYFSDLLLPNNLKFTTNILEAVSTANDLLIAVPSSGFLELIEQIRPHLHQNSRIIWATKGLDANTNKFFSEIIYDCVPINNIPIAILSGPSFAKEVIDGLPTAVVIAVKDQPEDRIFADDLIKYFHSDSFRVYLSYDLLGVQLGGVFKNILAIAAGICDGLGFGINTRAALITRGIAEILRLAEHVGAKKDTLMGLSGLGDIFLSCSDNKSRNRRFGVLLASGHSITEAKAKIGQAIEALDNVNGLYQLSIEKNVSMPIVHSVWQIINNHISLQQAAEGLLSREPQLESL
jgi:glycerol-3-phosphate dehydrogenase (NAD(P)+)